MVARVKFILNPQGVRDLLKEDFVRAELTRRAERVQQQAQAGDPNFTYHIEQATTDRAVVRVGSDDEGAIFAELDTGNLVRALDAASGSS
jgi:hypothetical protein